MGIGDKMSRLFGFDDDDREIETAEKDDAPKVETKEQPADNYAGRNNIVDFNSATSGRENNAPRNVIKSKITTMKPKDFEDAKIVARFLRENIPVIINFEDTDSAEARRIYDFINGTTHAINGTIDRVAQNVIICAPENVKVTYTNDDKKSINKFLD